MKKIIAAFLSGAIAMSLCIFGAYAVTENESAELSAVGMPNPIHEETNASILAKTGFQFQEPAGSEDVTYICIDGDHPIAEMSFRLDGRNWTYRLSATDREEDISGMYYKWKKTAKADVDYNKAKVSWIKGEQGMIQWYDVVPGVMYSLSVDSGADKDLLVNMANALFLPLQGEAEGSFAADFTDILYDIQQNYHVATAGCSLNAARLAGECMDLFTVQQPKAEDVSAVLAEFASSLSGAEAAAYPQQLEGIISGGQTLLSENGAGMLESCGYESEWYPWDAAQMEPLLAAMKLG